MSDTRISMSPDGEFGRRVIELWNLGHGQLSIALTLGVASNVIRHFLKVNQMKRTRKEQLELQALHGTHPAKKPPLMPEDEFRKAMEGCYTTAQLAKKLKVTCNAVISLKRRYGIRWPVNYSRKGYSIYDTEA